MDGLIGALTETPTQYANSTTVEFKPIPFQNTQISREGITELVLRQNDFLHATMATPVVYRGKCDDIFFSEEEDVTYEETIRAWDINAKTKEDTFPFHSIESGRKCQSFFLQKNR